MAKRVKTGVGSGGFLAALIVCLLIVGVSGYFLLFPARQGTSGMAEVRKDTSPQSQSDQQQSETAAASGSGGSVPVESLMENPADTGNAANTESAGNTGNSVSVGNTDQSMTEVFDSHPLETSDTNGHPSDGGSKTLNENEDTSFGQNPDADGEAVSTASSVPVAINENTTETNATPDTASKQENQSAAASDNHSSVPENDADTVKQDASPAVNIPASVSLPVSMPIESDMMGEILSVFSMDELVFDTTMKDWRIHDGIDIAAEEGTPVLAACDGVVTSIADDTLMGICITIAHPDGTQTCYANLQTEPVPDEGDTVLAGEQIGLVGTTAAAESALSPHLHFSVSRNGKAVNPEEFLVQK